MTAFIRRAAALLATLGGGAIAHAGPTARFGSTAALSDTNPPDTTTSEWGPVIAAGYRLGPVEAEAEYAYLIASDGVTEHGSHRFGGGLRVQVLGLHDAGAMIRLAADAGAALRHGNTDGGPAAQDGHEVYEGISLAFGAETAAWMFELRHVSGAWDHAGVACRGCTQAAPGDEAWMLEATFAIGR